MSMRDFFILKYICQNETKMELRHYAFINNATIVGIQTRSTSTNKTAGMSKINKQTASSILIQPSAHGQFVCWSVSERRTC